MTENPSELQDIQQRLNYSLGEMVKQGSSRVRAGIEITGKCGGNCPQCYAISLKKYPPMTEAVFDLTISALKDQGFKESYIVGGEPMLHKDVLEFCRKAKNKGISPILVTTGFYLDDPDKAKEILETVDQVEISVRSVHPNVHDNVVSGVGWSNEEVANKPKMGSFDQALGALKMLTRLKEKLGLETKLAINHDLYNNQERFGDGRSMVWAIAKKLHDEEIKINGFYLQCIDCSGRATEGLVEENQIKKDDFLLVLEDLDRVSKKFGIDDVGVTDDPVRLGILKEEEIPENLKYLIVGEVIPAISPIGEVRRNIVEE